MTIGVGTFVPSAMFAFPRSYVYQVVVNRYGDTLSHVAGRFTIYAVPPDPTFAIIQFSPTWWTWNSNARSLDHIVTEFWYKNGGVGPELPLPYKVTFKTDPVTLLPSLFFDWTPLPDDYERFPLQAQPSNYWLPMPLP